MSPNLLTVISRRAGQKYQPSGLPLRPNGNSQKAVDEQSSLRKDTSRGREQCSCMVRTLQQCVHEYPNRGGHRYQSNFGAVSFSRDSYAQKFLAEGFKVSGFYLPGERIGHPMCAERSLSGDWETFSLFIYFFFHFLHFPTYS